MAPLPFGSSWWWGVTRPQGTFSALSEEGGVGKQWRRVLQCLWWCATGVGRRSSIWGGERSHGFPISGFALLIRGNLSPAGL